MILVLAVFNKNELFLELCAFKNLSVAEGKNSVLRISIMRVGDELWDVALFTDDR